MAKLNAQQLEALWIQAGGDPQKAAFAASIALAESGGAYGDDPSATHTNTDGSIDRGPWQVNSVHGAQSTTDPLANARAAVAISGNGADWKQWSTAWSDGAGGTRGGTYLGRGAPYQRYGDITTSASAAVQNAPRGTFLPQNVGSAGGGSPTAPPAALPTQPGASAEQIAISRYGLFASYLNDPEWGPIIKQAATEGRDEAWLEGQLSQTNKWKTTSDTARQFDFTATTDPATAQAQVQTQLFSIRAYARANGIVLDDNTLNQLATASARLGWSADEMHAMVGAHFTYTAGQAEGAAGADAASFKQLAADYGVAVSDDTIGGFVTAVVQGNATKDDFTTWIRDTAKQRFPSIAPQLDAGLTTKQVFSPIGQQIGKTLGISPDTIDVSDPKWARFLAPAPDPTTGQPAPNATGVMNAWQIDQTIKSDDQYGYRYSQDAHDQGAALLDTLGKTFGKIGA